jgi:membrane-bound ClpP family serine protease
MNQAELIVAPALAFLLYCLGAVVLAFAFDIGTHVVRVWLRNRHHE